MLDNKPVCGLVDISLGNVWQSKGLGGLDGGASVGVSGPRAAPLAVVPLVVALLSVALQQPVLRLVPVGVVGAARVPAVRLVHVPVCANVAGGGVLVVFLVLFLLLLVLHGHPVAGAPPAAAGQGVAGLV